MTRNLLLALAVLLAMPAVAATPCNLQMTVTCQAGAHGGPGTCTSTTLNAGNTACTGEYLTGWFAEASAKQVSVQPGDNTRGLDECFGSDELGAEAEQPFSFCLGSATLPAGASFTSSATFTGATAGLPIIGLTYVFDDDFETELALAYAFANVDQPSCTPTVSAPPIVQSGAEYAVTWTNVSDANAQYIVEEATNAEFTTSLTSTTVAGVARTFRHDVGSATIYYYRVRPTTCSGGTPTNSQVAQTIVQAPPPPARDSAEVTVPIGSTTPVQIPIFIPGPSGKTALADVPFTATTDKPFLTVTPSSGTIPPRGTTVTVTASPSGLSAGANTGTVSVTSNGAPVANVPVSISIVTPVSPGGKSTPPASALIIPVVTHVNGAAGPFLSDVRLTNAGSTAVKYQVTMTPTRSDATTSSKVTQVTVDSQQTVALNDIARTSSATAQPARRATSASARWRSGR
jgi:hypothetical protein